MKSKNDAIFLKNGEDAWEMIETVLCTKRQDEQQIPKSLFAGGGHSGLLTEDGRLYLWGWNQHGQLGTSGPSTASSDAALPCVEPLHLVV